MYDKQKKHIVGMTSDLPASLKCWDQAIHAVVLKERGKRRINYQSRT